MRYLNKVILINSAFVKYAEVQVGGNVHFIGTQGVGKSTLLRAILFFYNADTQKLGIENDKKSFSEYYFPTADSYIIYEIAKETGTYSALCYKHLGKICFRFFDSEYKQSLFINEQNKAYENWEQIKEQLNINQIASSNKIDRYEDYRDILYGNNDGKKEYRKYALLESKQYQNIPRTIQNVLLNAELKAEFIKQTIIKSLSDDDIEIDLKIYIHELKSFDAQLTDIKKWTEKNKNGEEIVKKQADQIAKLHTTLKYLEREKYQLSKELAWAINNIEVQKPKLEEKLELQEGKKTALLKKIAELNEVFQKKRDKILGDIKVLKSNIDKAKEKDDDYRQKNIDDIIQRASKKPVLLSNQENLLNEKQILSAQFTELTQRFEALLKEVENQKQGFENIKKEEKNNIQSKFLSFKDEANTLHHKIIKQIKEEHKERLETAKVFLEEKRKSTSLLNDKKTEIKHKRYLDIEIESKKSEITDLKNSKLANDNQIKHFKTQIESVQKQFELEEQSKRDIYSRLIEKLNDKIQVFQAKIDEINFNIANSKDSLFGWLNDNYSGWEKTIGKVINNDKSVLFNSSLSPKLLAKSATFYGIELNLSEINNNIKTIADYQKDKVDLTKEIEIVKNNIAEQAIILENDLEKLKSKYLPKIKEYKEEVKEHTYHSEQNASKQDAAKLALIDFEKAAKAEKENDLAKIDSEIGEATTLELNAKDALEIIEKEIIKIEKEKEKEKDKKIYEEKLKVEVLQIKIDEELKKSNLDYAQKQKEIKESQHSELANKGADTKKIKEIDSKLEAVETELKFIENNNRLLIEYEKDKRELFDKVGDFKNQKEIFEKNLNVEEDKHQQQKEKQKIDIETIDELLKNLNQKKAEYIADLKEYESFIKTEIYQNIPFAFKESKDVNKTNNNCTEIIKSINISDNSYTKRLAELRDEVIQFTGNFSVDNIFKFKTSFVKSEEYLQFADELNEFIEENKIERFERDVNERFAYIIHTIGKETGNLMSKGGAIQKTITKINNDFVDKGAFVTAIKKIELRWVESSNKIVSYLINIDKFNNENKFLGTNNLFATQDIDKKNKQAIELLKALLKTITESKKDKITLSDSFELQFRIIENQNDTGWQEKLDRVGSEGTGILVKAMINIMLLNVSKGESSKQFKDFNLHCMMDEIGKLHSNNMKGLLKFANERNIFLINGSPEENNALGYKHIYQLYKDDKNFTKVKRLITNFNQE
jgi:hypothetical protein